MLITCLYLTLVDGSYSCVFGLPSCCYVLSLHAPTPCAHVALAWFSVRVDAHHSRQNFPPLPPLSIMRQLQVLLASWMMATGASCSRHHYVKTPAPPTADPGLQDKFEDIYRTNFWGSDEDNGGSGDGSNTAATQYTMSCIRAVVNKYELTSMVDAPCGGMHWMPTLLRDLRDDFPDFSFLGVDIVRSVIQANQAKFANETWMQFDVLDFTQIAVPDDVQLIHCRDALQHLPTEKAIDALELFSKSKARFLLVGSYFGVENTNRRIDAGDYYDINLTLEPFSLTGYQHVYREHTQELIPAPDKHLLLYSISYLRGINFAALRAKVSKFDKGSLPNKLNIFGY